jgi:Uma2 family endonuclease
MDILAKKIFKSPYLEKILKDLETALQDEQERRKTFYEWVDDSIKAEFILGEIVLHSPALNKHNVTQGLLQRILAIYAEQQGLGLVLGEKAMIHLTRNSYEPDICFWGNEKAKHFTPNTLLYPAPDFVVEILSKRTKRNDRGIKFEDYFKDNVPEYWIIDPDKQKVEQYYISPADDEKYVLFGIWDENHVIESKAIKGFQIPVSAIFNANSNREALKGLFK